VNLAVPSKLAERKKRRKDYFLDDLRENPHTSQEGRMGSSMKLPRKSSALVSPTPSMVFFGVGFEFD
jgi:hypothetical protein